MRSELTEHLGRNTISTVVGVFVVLGGCNVSGFTQADFDDEVEEAETAMDEAHEVLGPMEAIHAMRKEFASRRTG